MEQVNKNSNSCWNRLSTVDLLELTSLDRIIFIFDIFLPLFSVTRLGEILLFGYFLLDHLLRFELNKQLGVDVLDFQFEL